MSCSHSQNLKNLFLCSFSRGGDCLKIAEQQFCQNMFYSNFSLYILLQLHVKNQNNSCNVSDSYKKTPVQEFSKTIISVNLKPLFSCNFMPKISKVPYTDFSQNVKKLWDSFLSKTYKQSFCQKIVLFNLKPLCYCTSM